MTAIDGIDALEKLRSKDIARPDLIFLDINMPRLNGKECLSELKKDPSLCHIPVVIYSTSRLIKDIQDIRGMGGIEFLTKPCSSQDLKTALTFMIEKLLPSKNSSSFYCRFIQCRFGFECLDGQ